MCPSIYPYATTSKKQQARQLLAMVLRMGASAVCRTPTGQFLSDLLNGPGLLAVAWLHAVCTSVGVVQRSASSRQLVTLLTRQSPHMSTCDACAYCHVDCRYYTPAWTAADSSSSRTIPPAQSNLQRQHIPQQLSTAPKRQQAHVGAQTTTSTTTTTPPFPKRLATHRSFYSFEMGGVHFLVLDSESPSNPDSPQGRFVAADLAQVRVRLMVTVCWVLTC